MSDITVSVSNKTNFPGQAGIPSLVDPFLPLDYTIESIYGNVGSVGYDLVFAPFSAEFTLNRVEIISNPEYFSIERLSPNSFRVIQNDKIFLDRYDFALFNKDASVKDIVMEEDVIPNIKKTPVSYTPPIIKMVVANFVVRYDYTTSLTPGTPPADANRNIPITQNIYWEYGIAINKLIDFVNRGDY